MIFALGGVPPFSGFQEGAYFSRCDSKWQLYRFNVIDFDEFNSDVQLI